MYRISKIDETISWFGMNYINIVVFDITGMPFYVQYEKGSKKFINRETGKIVEEPVMWDYLPKINHEIAEEEYRLLYE